jgi:CelD/BcsL family acetyltransferase involved in cellulose biosynthesis
MGNVIVNQSTLHISPKESTGADRMRRLTHPASLTAELPEWDPAVFGAGAMTPMQSRAWIAACAEAFPQDRGLNILVVEDREGVAGVAPLICNPSFPRTGQLVGVNELGEPSDLIYRDGQALAALVGVLVRERIPLMFQRVPASSASVEAIRRGFRGAGVVIVRPANNCPYIALRPGEKTPDELLSGSLRSDLRRAERKAEALGKVSYEIHAPRTAAEFLPLYEQALKVEAAGWKGRGGSAVAKNEKQRAFFARYGQLASQAGQLRLACLRIDGVLAAMQYAVEWNGAFWLFKVGYDEAFAKCSPGQLLMHHTLRYAVDRGLESYEFLGSAESWTQRWTTAERSTVRIAVFPFRPAGMFTLGREVVRSVRRKVGLRLEAHRKARARDAGETSVAGDPVPSSGKSVSPVRALRAGVHSLVGVVSRNYIAGPTLADAARVGQPLASRGYWLTLGYWDGSGDSADLVLETYLASCAYLASLGGRNYLSIKIPALGYDSGRFRALERKSRESGVPLHFDALDTGNASATLDFIADQAARSGGEVGCTLPGRWQRSLGDAERAIALGLMVRVVKGQSPDPADPDRDPAAGYLAVVRTLAGRARGVRVATHDPVVARESLSILKAANTPCELELLYGLPVGIQVALAEEFHVPVRVYVAFGHAFLPYALSSLRRHPAAVLRLLREAARGDCLSTFPQLAGGRRPASAR